MSDDQTIAFGVIGAVLVLNRAPQNAGMVVSSNRARELDEGFGVFAYAPVGGER